MDLGKGLFLKLRFLFRAKALVLFLSAFSLCPISAASFVIPKELRQIPFDDCVLSLRAFALVARANDFDDRAFWDHFDQGPEALRDHLLRDPVERHHFISYYERFFGGDRGFDNLLVRRPELLKVLFLNYRSFSQSGTSWLSHYYRKLPGFFELANQSRMNWADYYNFYRFFDVYKIFEYLKSQQIDSEAAPERGPKVSIDHGLFFKSRQNYLGGMDALERDILEALPHASHRMIPEIAILAGDDLSRRTQAKLPAIPAYDRSLSIHTERLLEALGSLFINLRNRSMMPGNRMSSSDRRMAQVFERRIRYFFTGDARLFSLLQEIGMRHKAEPLYPGAEIFVDFGQIVLGGTPMDTVKIDMRIPEVSPMSLQTTIVHVTP